MSRIKNWTKLNAEGLWEAWRGLFESEDEAVATAVWSANRLVKKSKSRHTRQVFYGIKDRFMRRYGRESVGQVVRREVDGCWRCEGQDPYCTRCDGTGVYRERTLYVHRFEVAGRPYCFHGYEPPAHLVAGQGEDAESYGDPFGEEELAELALPLSGLVRMLRYVDKVVWGPASDPPSVPPKGREGPSVRYFWVGGVQ